MDRLQDIDPQETREWLDSLEAVLEIEGPERAHFLLEQLVDKARRSGAYMPVSARNTAYINTIPPHLEERSPGDAELETRIRSLVRWNAMAMVVRAGKKDLGARRPHRELRLGRDALRRRLQPFLARAQRQASAATSIYFQGHSVARHLRARLPRRPHHRRAARQLPPGSRRQGHLLLSASVADAGLLAVPDGVDGPGPDQAIYQARFLHYLRTAGIANTEGRKVWAFMGDGEMDEPESLGAISLAGAREPRQPHLRHQLQPAAPRRPGARQRQDHPGARGRLPRRRLERDQGDLGLVLGSAASRATRTACC